VGLLAAQQMTAEHPAKSSREAALRADCPLITPPLAQVGMRQGGVRRVLVPVPLAGSPSQISSKLGLGFGPRRQLERQLNRSELDKDNIFFYELSLDKAQPPSPPA
jgi:hypothetical protein